MNIEVENTTVAEAYDVIEKLLHPKERIVIDYPLTSESIINALNTVYRKGVADAEAIYKEKKSEFETP